MEDDDMLEMLGATTAPRRGGVGEDAGDEDEEGHDECAGAPRGRWPVTTQGVSKYSVEDDEQDLTGFDEEVPGSPIRASLPEMEPLRSAIGVPTTLLCCTAEDDDYASAGILSALSGQATRRGSMTMDAMASKTHD